METLEDLCIVNVSRFFLQLINVLELRNDIPGIARFVFLILRATVQQRIRTGPIQIVRYVLGETNVTVLPSSCLVISLPLP